MLTTDPLWEQSLLAMAVGQSAVMLDVLTLSRASFAPTGAGSLIPAAAHHLVQRHAVALLGQAQGDQVLLRAVQGTLGVEGFEIALRTATV